MHSIDIQEHYQEGGSLTVSSSLTLAAKVGLAKVSRNANGVIYPAVAVIDYQSLIRAGRRPFPYALQE